ncbi:CpaF family protein [Candidatus Pyrohabitans sp.]
MQKIHEKVGDRYRNLFVTDAKKIDKLIQEIGAEVGEVSQEAVRCYVYENLSLGRLTPLMMDDNLEEIMIVAQGLPVYIFDRIAGMKETDVLLEEDEIERIIKRIARYNGREVDARSPLLDARLPDGSRVNATLPEVSPRGSTLTIRKFRRESLTIVDLIRFGTLTPRLAAYLWLAVEGLRTKPANILIIGGTASGKTTTLNALSAFVPETERIISIEDVLEISLVHRHWIPMETRPPDSEGNEITMDDLLKNALRMRPDRILVGEVRGKEALTLFTAMNTGHDGCIATLHANSAKETLSRLTSHPMNIPKIMIPALDIIVAQKRQLERGTLKRRVFEVLEISGTEGDNILTNTLFRQNPKTGKVEEVLINGRYLQQLSVMSDLSLKEIDAELKRREALLEVMAKKKLKMKDIHEVVQLYYWSPNRAVEVLERHITGVGQEKKGWLDI